MPPTTSPQSLVLVTGQYRSPIHTPRGCMHGCHTSASESFGRSFSGPVRAIPTDTSSGASGFLGAWIVHTLLQRNYRVRAAVRSSDTANDLKDIFKQHADHLEFAVIEDIFKVCGPYKSSEGC